MTETDMDTIIIEIRAAEGGQHSKNLVGRQFVIYGKWAERRRL